MMDPAEQKTPLSTSMFYMWRCLLAVAWADGNCGKEETDYFAKVFENLNRFFDLTQDQRDALADDLINAKKIDGLYAHINDPEARDTLVGFATDLALLDGVLDPNEEDILKRLHLHRNPAYDKEALRLEIRQLIEGKRAERAAERGALRNEIRAMSPLYNAVDRILMKLGIDVIL